MTKALDILRSRFGYPEFRFQQQQIIDTLVAGEDALVLMPTGGGKSLCYQIPALIRDGVGIVISPLIALMQDQVDALALNGINAAFLNSTQTSQQQFQIRQQVMAGDIDLLYVAPERALTEDFLQLLHESRIALFAIDEAHCVSQWGHDFRKDYQQLCVLHERYPRVPRIALTATADMRTRREIVDQLDLHRAGQFVSSFDRPNIRYSIGEAVNAKSQLWDFLEREHPDDAGIIYCLSRKRVDEVANWLCEKGRTALPYHAGLSQEERRLHQERYLREDGLVIVATIAFGMGIDKPDVRFVAHLNLPKSVDAYYQETGRAGRDGEPADAWLLYGLQDLITLRQFVFNTDAEERFKRIAHQKLESLLGLCDLTGCRRQALLAYFGETREEPCGNCDNCLRPPQTWDASEYARMALSCVYRTGQGFGVNYVIDVLRGKADDRIRRNGHDRISTFGIGGEQSAVQWRSLFRQLISQGYIDIDPGGYGALRLSGTCRPLLRGETGLQLRKHRPREKQTKKPAKQPPIQTRNLGLFDALRTLRTEIAREQGVPPYIIFHDRTLHEMAERQPENPEQMRGISGVGEQKLKRYGSRFLDLLRSLSLGEAGTPSQ
jgi:ATP-dependent DNA helicase RecQ